jgi:hypothetical protein
MARLGLIRMLRVDIPVAKFCMRRLAKRVLAAYGKSLKG